MEVETGYSQAIQKSIFFDCVKLDRLLFLGACLITPKHSDEINNLSEWLTCLLGMFGGS